MLPQTHKRRGQTGAHIGAAVLGAAGEVQGKDEAVLEDLLRDVACKADKREAADGRYLPQPHQGILGCAESRESACGADLAGEGARVGVQADHGGTGQQLQGDHEQELQRQASGRDHHRAEPPGVPPQNLGQNRREVQELAGHRAHWRLQAQAPRSPGEGLQGKAQKEQPALRRTVLGRVRALLSSLLRAPQDRRPGPGERQLLQGKVQRVYQSHKAFFLELQGPQEVYLLSHSDTFFIEKFPKATFDFF